MKNIFYFTLLTFILFETWYFFSRQNKQSLKANTRAEIFEARFEKIDELIGQNKKDNFPLIISSGRWSFIFVGYTSCPDVCPTTMMLLSDVFNRLEKVDYLQDQYQGVFVAIDFKNDKIDNVKKYASQFHKNILGLLTEKEETDRLVNWIGAGYSVEPDAISHSTSVYLVNPTGDLVGEFINPNSSEEIARTFAEIYKKNTEPIVIKNFRIQTNQSDSKVLAGYFDIYNNTINDIELKKVMCEGYDKTEIHNMKIDEERRMMKMEKLHSFMLESSSKAEFKPKNKHLMIYVDKKPNFDEHIKCKFEFDNNQKYVVRSKIVKGFN